MAIGTPWAIKMKIEELETRSHNIFCFPINDPVLYQFLEDTITKDHPLAIFKKFNGLLCGENSYKQDQVAAYVFLEDQIRNGNESALDIKFNELENTAAHAFLEAEIAKGNLWAIKKKFDGLLNGEYHYSKDQAAADAFMTSILGIKMLKN